MSGYLMKPASEEALARIDWTQGYLEPGEEVSADLGWAVSPGGEIGVQEQRVDGCASYAKLADGVPGRVYMVSARAQTNRGRALERAIVVRISA